MLDMDKFYSYLNEVELPFKGQPHQNIILVKVLITKANPFNGMIKEITYNELATFLSVKSAPGRKNTGTPTKQAIRNYIKSIEKECGDYFKVVTDGQNLQFIFQHIPDIYKKYFQTKAQNNTENNISTYQDMKGQNTFFDEQLHIESNTPLESVKNIIYINNKTNNNNSGKKITNRNLPKLISQDFYPSQETIVRAIAAGHNNATDSRIIQEFIDKNTAWGSTFADFNPIYLSFLAKHAERIAIKYTRSSKSECKGPSSKISSYDAAMDQARKYNSNACKPSENHVVSNKEIIRSEHATHFLAMDGINKDIWSTVSY